MTRLTASAPTVIIPKLPPVLEDLWYVPEYPVEAIDPPKRTVPPDHAMVAALTENIRQHGLVNPLIIHHRHGLTVGGNRLIAIQTLGYVRVPVLYQGPKPAYPRQAVTPNELPALFRDGTPYLSALGVLLAGATLPESYTYPRLPTE